MGKNIFRVILIMLLLWTFYIIFQFSSEDSTESSARSGSVMRKIIDIFPYTRNLSENAKQEIVEKAQPIIRKLAHFSIYSFVGILIMSFVSTYRLLFWKKFMISISTGLIYAISDEYHQSFIPGRSAELRDVFIDTTGVVTGIFIVLICICIYKSIKKEQNLQINLK